MFWLANDVSSISQSSSNSSFLAGMMVGVFVLISVSVSLVFCRLCAQVCSPLLIPIRREKEVGHFLLFFHGELDVFILAINVLKKKL